MCQYFPASGFVAPLVLICFLYQAGSLSTEVSAAESSTGPELQQQLQALLAQRHERASDPAFLLRVADVYMSLGDDISLDIIKRGAAYDEGARFARQAIDLQETNADAHYLYAANLGNAAQLKGTMASALTVQEIKRHVKRALELNPDHAQALHMMGMMLEKLPWLLGGDAEGALTYLRRAVVADPTYLHARLDLARAYIKRKDSGAARRELEVIVQQPVPPNASASNRRQREDARQLLNSLRSS